MKSTSLYDRARKINENAVSGNDNNFDIQTSWSALNVKKIGKDYYEASQKDGHFRTGTADKVYKLVRPYLRN